MFAITDVARLTKVSALTLRTWESRYGVVSPGRGDDGKRGYSLSEMRRLNLIAEGCRSGFRIGQLVDRSTPELALMMRARRGAWRPQYTEVPELAEAARTCQVGRMEVLVRKSLARRALTDFADHVFAPCVGLLGQAACPPGSTARQRVWTGVLMEAVSGCVAQGDVPRVSSAHVLAGTLGPEAHALGALMCYGVARLCGATAVNLGIDLQVQELVELAHIVSSPVIALSFVEDVSVQRLTRSMTTLDHQLPAGCRVILGGRGLTGVQDTLLPSRCIRIRSLSEFADVLLLLLSESFPLVPGRVSADQGDRQ